MTGAAVDTKVAVEKAKAVTGVLPQAGKIAVLDQLVSDMAPEALKALSAPAQEKLLQALRSTETAPSATTSPAGGRFETIDGHSAVVGIILVEGKRLDTLLSEGSFNKSRADEIAYAKKLGYQIASPKEQRRYLESLLGKDAEGSINRAEWSALQIHMDKYVRNTEAGLGVEDGRVCTYLDPYWSAEGDPDFGALFVRASEKSK